MADGDTITVLDGSLRQHKIRMDGIDAPEKAQPFGQRSKLSLSELVYGKAVEIETHKRDRYGREVGKIASGSPCRKVPLAATLRIKGRCGGP